MAAVLETLKMTQYKYKREDVVRLYHFIADVIEKGNFEWPGKIDLKPFEKNDKIETKEVESTVVSASEDITSKKSQKRSAKPVEDERRLV